jgi:hypothetical protein
MAFTNFTKPNPNLGGAAVAIRTVTMKLNRNKTVRSTLGHMLTFQKDIPMEIPQIMVRSCAEIGAERVDGKDAIVEAPVKEAQPVDPGHRLEDVGKAIEEIVERNNSLDFTAAGLPKIKVVSTAVGYRVDKTEVMTAWKARIEDDE